MSDSEPLNSGPLEVPRSFNSNPRPYSSERLPATDNCASDLPEKCYSSAGNHAINGSSPVDVPDRTVAKVSSSSSSESTESASKKKPFCEGAQAASETDEGSQQGSLTLVEPLTVVSANGKPSFKPNDCQKSRNKTDSSKSRLPQVSARQKVQEWLEGCEGDEQFSLTEGGGASEPVKHEPITLVLQNEGGNGIEEEINQLPIDSELFEQLLSNGCKLLEIDSCRENEHLEIPEDTKIYLSPDAKENDDETSSSDTSSFYVPPDNIKRSASLKTGKTPPGTPGRKKFVRFADAMGLDLQQIRTFKDEIPIVPPSAFKDLERSQMNTWTFVSGNSTRSSSHRRLILLFQPPSQAPGFMERLRHNKVLVESVSCREEDSQIRCIVRVMNINFHKQVRVRFTMDNWSTWSERAASYMMGSSDGETDRFETILYASTLGTGQRIQMAVVFSCCGREYWDSNNGLNYTVLCSPSLDHRSQISPEDWTGGEM